MCLLMDGWGHAAKKAHVNGTDKDLLVNLASWSNNITVTSLASQSYGERCYLTATKHGNGAVTRTVAGTGNSIVIGMRIYLVSTGDVLLCEVRDGSLFLGFIGVLADGSLTYAKHWNIASAAERAGKSTVTIGRNAWHFVEVKVTFNNTTGSAQYQVDGQDGGTFTNRDTLYDNGAANCTNLRLFIDSGWADWDNSGRLGDLYIDDSVLRGPSEFWYRKGDTAGSAANWTPSAGSNHQNVDELGNDGDSTYNESTATTTLDQIAISGSLPKAPWAVQPIAIARYVPTGSANLKLGVKSGATHSQDAGQALVDSYDGIAGLNIHLTDPNTAAAWTAAAADAAEVTYEHA